uniref:Uncharacterized protein n=1 Tax=Sphaerodactylus townsendi TaxID=933632 RepID=A0ACB8E519_9SAUR
MEELERMRQQRSGGDVGGERVLQRRWTTFLKAQLLCSRPRDGFPFNVLQDVFTLTPGERWLETVFYGVFSSQWDRKGSVGTAVCAFSMADVKEAFNGLYKEISRETQQWYTDTHPVPEPRPGACITSRARHMKITSSLQMPDRVLNYLKDHFLMDSAVRSQPLLLQGQAHYQQISAQRVQGLHRTYDVLFLGAGDGRLHKAVAMGQQAHIIEEIQLFPVGQPVLKLLLDPTQARQGGLLYAASYSALAQLPVANCSRYRSCGECILARDPYCAWSGEACRPVPLYQQQPAAPWAQDIETAAAEQLCQTGHEELSQSTAAKCQPLWLTPNAVKLLPCPRLSNLASRQWVREGAALNDSFLVLPKGELVLVGSPDQAGHYECWSQERGFRQLMANYCVRVELAAPDWLVPPEGPLETISTSRSTSSVAAAAGGIAALLEGKTYWTEFLVMCVLFGLMVTLLTLFVLHRHQNAMKGFLKQGRCNNAHAKKLCKAGLPTESLPLNGTSAPSTLPDHKGYQTLDDRHVASTPLRDAQAPPGMAFLEADQQPRNVHESFVEMLVPSQRLRVRLGSEIRDSVV